MLILEIREPGQEVYVQELAVEDKALKVGRLESCRIRLQHDSVSRLHAVISRQKKFFGGWVTLLSDLGSDVVVNDQVVKAPVRIKSGDRIRLGEVELAVLSD